MTATSIRPARPLDVLALQYGRPNRMIGIPLLILGAVVALTVLISIAVLRAGGRLGGADGAGSVVWGVLGYTVAVGVQNVSTSFPFALALGSTRRAFVLGNLLTAVVQAALVAVAAVLLLAVETATGGWFIGAHVLTIRSVGDGDPALLAGGMFLAVLTALLLGGVFGAAWTRFGSRGPLLLALGIAAVVVVLALAGASAPAAGVDAILSRPWLPGAVAAGVAALALLGQYLLLRRASVR